MRTQVSRHQQPHAEFKSVELSSYARTDIPRDAAIPPVAIRAACQYFVGLIATKAPSMPPRSITRLDAESSASADAISKDLAELPAHSAESLRALRRRWTKNLRQLDGASVLAIANSLVAAGGFANRFVACELLTNHPPAFALITSKRLIPLGRGMSSWGEVDVFACYVSGPAWRKGQVTDAEIDKWTRSKDRWWRRAALVSTVPLNQKSQGGTGDVRRTLRICRALLDDRDQMVVQAMSWALRALATREPQHVRRFLESHKDRLAPRVIRETMNKIKTGRKSGKPSST